MTGWELKAKREKLCLDPVPFSKRAGLFLPSKGAECILFKASQAH